MYIREKVVSPSWAVAMSGTCECEVSNHTLRPVWGSQRGIATLPWDPTDYLFRYREQESSWGGWAKEELALVMQV